MRLHCSTFKATIAAASFAAVSALTAPAMATDSAARLAAVTGGADLEACKSAEKDLHSALESKSYSAVIDLDIPTDCVALRVEAAAMAGEICEAQNREIEAGLKEDDGEAILQLLSRADCPSVAALIEERLLDETLLASFFSNPSAPLPPTLDGNLAFLRLFALFSGGVAQPLPKPPPVAARPASPKPQQRRASNPQPKQQQQQRAPQRQSTPAVSPSVGAGGAGVTLRF